MKGRIIGTIIVIIIVVGIYFLNTNETNTQNNEKIEENTIIQEDLLTTEQAKELLEEKHELVLELISLDEKHFNWSLENYITTTSEEGLTFAHYEITNYEEVCSKYLTNNAQEYFDKNAICLSWINGKPYISEGGAGKSINGDIEFKNISVSDNTIEATVEMTLFDYEENENLGKVESKFELKKENEDWKIEEFLSVDDLENWKEI